MATRHLVIAGTGRAGTSFLVRWLGESGLDIGTFPATAWNDEIQAGLERVLTGNPDLPYVVKDPWLFGYLDHIQPEWIDLLVIPMRDLDAAAESRVRQERAAENRPNCRWNAKHPAGVVYTVNAADQARVLAEGHYRLHQWAVTNEVPTLFLDFPRIINHGTYLVDRLIEHGIPIDPVVALEAHTRLAKPRP